MWMARTRPIGPVETIDWHTGGEPFRIVVDSPAAVTGEGLTVAERRVAAIGSEEAQWARALLCGEPRGHSGMYGGFLVPPDDAGAHLRRTGCASSRSGWRLSVPRPRRSG
jgi:proline racemase